MNAVTGQWEEEKADPLEGMLDVLFMWCMYCYFCGKYTLISVIHALLFLWLSEPNDSAVGGRESRPY